MAPKAPPVSNESTVELLAKFLRTRKKSALALIAADYVEEYPDAECVQKALSYFRHAFVPAITYKLRYYDWHYAPASHHQSILYYEWGNLAIAYLLGDISLVTTMNLGNKEGLCNISFTWITLLENRKKDLEIACRDSINKIGKWLAAGILYRLKRK